MSPDEAQGRRLPAAAGLFYSADPGELEREIAWCFAHPLGPGAPAAAELAPPIAVISPHAGLRYSGPFAAHAYAGLGPVQTAIVVGPNHRGRGARLAVAPAAPWATPLGDVEGAPGLVAALRDLCPRLVVDAAAHAAEHSVELQAIFLRHVLGPALRLVAITLWGVGDEEVALLARALAAVQAEWPSLLVASTDLSHYRTDEAARRLDHRCLEAIESLDTARLSRLSAAGAVELCGAGPTLAVLGAARELGATRARLLRYGTSHDTGGPADAVVGYAALRIDPPSVSADRHEGTSEPDRAE